MPVAKAPPTVAQAVAGEYAAAGLAEILTAPTGGDAGRSDRNGGGRGTAAPTTRAAPAPRAAVYA